MPNEVTFHDEKTITKVIRALVENDAMSATEALDVITRIQNAGILFREKPAKETPTGAVKV